MLWFHPKIRNAYMYIVKWDKEKRSPLREAKKTRVLNACLTSVKTLLFRYGRIVGGGHNDRTILGSCLQLTIENVVPHALHIVPVHDATVQYRAIQV